MTAITMLLDNDTWDLVVTPEGDFGVATDAASLAQDAASAIRTFQAECWYDVTQGVPYIQSIFGKRPAPSFVKAKVKTAAKTVPDIETVSFDSLALNGRALNGRIILNSTIEASF